MAKKPKNAKNGKGKSAKGGRGKKIAIILVVVVVLLGGGGAALYFTGLLDSIFGIDVNEVDIVKEVPKQELVLAAPAYHDLPEFFADLKIDTDTRPPFLKLRITVQVAEDDLPIVLEKEAKIIDRIQRLLRDQTRLDLTGARGAEQLREDIVIIMNQTLDPVEVHNVLFRQMVLQ